MADSLPSHVSTSRRSLAVIVVVGFFGLGWLVTLVVCRPAQNVTAPERDALKNRVNELRTLHLPLTLAIGQKITKETGQDSSGRSVEKFVLHSYTFFGLRYKKTNLDCWISRPGIDGETSASGIESFGSLNNGVWCDGIAF